MSVPKIPAIAMLALAAALAGCGARVNRSEVPATAVRPELAFDGYPLDTAFNEEMYFSKEAASGGRTLGGGACGCN